MTEFNAMQTVRMLNSMCEKELQVLAAAPWLPGAPRKPHFLGDTQTGRAGWACDRQGCSRERGSQGEV